MRFPHILADPAWDYNNRLTGKGRTKFGSGASGKYHTEAISEMATFKVQDVAAERCNLYMWTTGPFLMDAGRLIEAWGFDYCTIAFVWVKVRKPPTRNKAIQWLYSHGVLPFIRWMTRILPGHYTASNVELVLLGTRGKPSLLPKHKLESQVVWEPEIIVEPSMQHSRKPDAVHEWIERNYAGPCLELFARREREGWTCLGDEIDGRDLRESLPALAKE